MQTKLTSLSSDALAPFDDIIDVRSEAEFAEDHLPGAINLPVLDNQERAEVGTIYVQDSRFRARKIGAAHVARNAAQHLNGPLAAKEGAWKPLVYCWRGGQRSGSFATILGQVGWRVSVLEGGYQSYRRLVAKMLHDAQLPHRFVILEGNTGTAKTALLELLADRGRQVLDLEAVAAHRGSLFGQVADPQPSQKMFESRVSMALAGMDMTRPVLLEAESSKIGEILLPPSLWSAMQAAPRIQIDAPLAARAQYLAAAYRDVVEDATRLRDTLDRLVPIAGYERISHWKALAATGSFDALAEGLMADHYDPRYAKSSARFAENVAARVSTDALDHAGLERMADQIDVLINKI